MCPCHRHYSMWKKKEPTKNYKVKAWFVFVPLLMLVHKRPVAFGVPVGKIYDEQKLI